MHTMNTCNKPPVNMRRTLRLLDGGMPMNTTPMSPQNSAALGNMQNTMVSIQSTPAAPAAAAAPAATRKFAKADYSLPGNTFSPMAVPQLRDGGEVSPWSMRGIISNVSKALTPTPQTPEQVQHAKDLADYKARAAAARNPAPAAAPAPAQTSGISGYVGNSALDSRMKAAGLRDGGEVSPWSMRGIIGNVSKALTPTPKTPEQIQHERDLAEYKARAAAARSAPAQQPAQQPAQAAPSGGISGYVGNSALQRREAAAGLRDGGEAPVMRNAKHGGWAPGEGEGDKTRALLEKDEFVVSRDMLASAPGLREQLHTLRGNVLAAKGKSVEQADAEAVSGGTLRANNGGLTDLAARLRTEFPNGGTSLLQTTGAEPMPQASLTADKVQEQKILQRHTAGTKLPNPALGDALERARAKAHMGWNVAPTAPNFETLPGAAGADNRIKFALPPEPINATTSPGATLREPPDITKMNQPGVDARNAQYQQRMAYEATQARNNNPRSMTVKELFSRGDGSVRGNNPLMFAPPVPQTMANAAANAAVHAGATPARTIPANAGRAVQGGVSLEPTAAGLLRDKLLGTSKDWSKVGELVDKARNLPGVKMSGKLLKGVAAPVSAYQTYQDVQKGDYGSAAVHGVDTAAGAALFTPAAPVAAGYLGARTAYEAPQMIRDELGESGLDAIGGTINQIGLRSGMWGTDDSAYMASKNAPTAPTAPAAPSYTPRPDSVAPWGNESRRQIANINAPSAPVRGVEDFTKPLSTVPADLPAGLRDGMIYKTKGANGETVYSGRNVSGDVSGRMLNGDGTSAGPMRGSLRSAAGAPSFGPNGSYAVDNNAPTGAAKQAQIDATLRNPDGSTWSARDNAVMAANLRDGVDPYRGTSRQSKADPLAALRAKAMDSNAIGHNGAARMLIAAEQNQSAERVADAGKQSARTAAELAQNNADRTHELALKKEEREVKEDARKGDERADKTERDNQEAGIKSFKSSFGAGPEAEVLAQEAWDEAVRAYPGFATMSPKEQAPHRADVISNMRLTAAARAKQNRGLSSYILPDHSAHAPLDAEALRNGTLEKRGYIAGMLAGGEEPGNDLFIDSTGKPARNFGHMSEVDRRWLLDKQAKVKAEDAKAKAKAKANEKH